MTVRSGMKLQECLREWRWGWGEPQPWSRLEGDCMRGGWPYLGRLAWSPPGRLMLRQELEGSQRHSAQISWLRAYHTVRPSKFQYESNRSGTGCSNDYILRA